MADLVPIDFEYSGTSEAKLSLICVAFEYKGTDFEYWLKTASEFKACKAKILELRSKGVVFVCWNGIAEGQSFISLGIHPVKCKWIDLQVEWKMLTNHCNKWAYGKQLVQGKEVFLPIPEYGGEKNKAKTSLASGCYKLLDIKIDTEHKDKMRDICIRNDAQELRENRQDIQAYCLSDIKNLVPMWEVIKSEFNRLMTKKTFYENDPTRETVTIDMRPKMSEVLLRGQDVARTAMTTSLGYPVNVEKMRNFSRNVPELLKELCEDINSQFDLPLFKWNNKDQRYSKDTKRMKVIISESKYKDIWAKTKPSTRFPEGSYSLKVDSFEKFFSYRHDFPKGDPFAQYMRYLKTTRSLNGFVPKGKSAKDKTTIYDSLGSDGRVRSYLNPYGSQSARFQPKMTSFIMLKSAFCRSLIEPKPGKAMAGIDYKSEEFLIGALMSNDKNMIEAYKSGDVYLYFAKLAGAVPWDGKKEDYKEARDLFKSTTLGISYLMGAVALGIKLTADTGKLYTPNDAKRLIDTFAKSYPDYTKAQDDIFETYKQMGCWKLPCGWTMLANNPNERSVKNMPVQGFGSSLLRKAIALSQDSGLVMPFTLHDACYIEFDSDNLKDVDTLKHCMREAFSHYFEGETKKLAHDLIKFDVNIWSPDYEDGEFTTPGGITGKKQKVYIDERSVNEYKRFSKYMES